MDKPANWLMVQGLCLILITRNRPESLMQPAITRLYPPSDKEFPLHGLYLAHGLHNKGVPGYPYVYSNFITSLDGRIAVASKNRSSHEVPGAVINPRDWRLYQELAGQADLLITSGRFFRQAAIGEEQEHLPVSHEAEFSDIRDWRKQQGLPDQPDIAVLSSSLDIPLASLEGYRDRRITVITGSQAKRNRVKTLTDNGIDVIVAGSGKYAEGGEMITALGERGYRSIYAIAGPLVFHTLLKANVLDRLYLTVTHQLLAGEAFDTFTQGAALDPVLGMNMVSLYYDPHAPPGASQWFTAFEPR